MPTNKKIDTHAVEPILTGRTITMEDRKNYKREDRLRMMYSNWDEFSNIQKYKFRADERKEEECDEWAMTISQLTGVAVEDVRKVYNSMIELIQLRSQDSAGCSIPKFGTVSKKIHKGHNYPLGSDKAECVVLPDYEVLKMTFDEEFKTNTLNNGIRPYEAVKKDKSHRK